MIVKIGEPSAVKRLAQRVLSRSIKTHNRVASIILLCFLSFTVAAEIKNSAAGRLTGMALCHALNDIVATKQYIYVVGARGHILRLPADAAGQAAAFDRKKVCGPNQIARPWQAADTGTVATLTSLIASENGQQLWAVGHDGVILHSANAGDSWSAQMQRIDSEFPLIWLDIVRFPYAGKVRLLATAAYGGLAISDDDGQTWRCASIGNDWQSCATVEFDAGHLHSVSVIGSRLFITAADGELYWSEDAGETWQLDETFDYGGSLFAASAAQGWLLVAGLRGHVFEYLVDLQSLANATAEQSPSLDEAADADDGWDEESDWQLNELATSSSIFAVAPALAGGYWLAGSGGRFYHAEQSTVVERMPAPRSVMSLLQLGDTLVTVGQAGIHRQVLTE